MPQAGGLLGRYRQNEPVMPYPVRPAQTTAPGAAAPTPAVSPEPPKMSREQAEQFENLKRRIKDEAVKLCGERGIQTTGSNAHEEVRKVLEEIMERDDSGVPRMQRVHFANVILDDMLGFGPLEQLLKNPAITEIMVNGPNKVFVEEKGKITLSPVKFKDESELLHIIEKIVAPIGRRIDESSPLVDARLPDGSRVNAVIKPIALDGASITIRKFSKEKLGPQDLLRFGSATPGMMQFLEAAVRGRCNILVSGGTGSGKTTLLNILSNFIPDGERVVTIEDSAELQLSAANQVRLESRKANSEGKGSVSIHDLVINSLRMRPDRIIIGECRGNEALEMLQAMNTGHDGSLSTIHSNSPKECLVRLETMVNMSGMNIKSVVKTTIGSAINLIVQQNRLVDGSRKIVAISEVRGYDPETDTIDIAEIFSFVPQGIEEGPSGEKKLHGYFTATGERPYRTLERCAARGIHLPENLFTPSGSPVTTN